MNGQARGRVRRGPHHIVRRHRRRVRRGGALGLTSDEGREMQIIDSVLDAEADRCARLRRIATGAFIAALVMAAAAFALSALAGASPSCGCALCAAAEKAGTKYAFVEQDDCFGEDPFDCLKKSYDFLASRGYR